MSDWRSKLQDIVGTKCRSEILKLDLSKELLQITDSDAMELCRELRTFDHLHTLLMHSNQLGAETIKSLSPELSHLLHLQELSLHRNKIGDDGIKELSRIIPRLLQLKTLILWNNGIGDEGAKSLLEAIPLMGSLEVLISASCCTTLCVLIDGAFLYRSLTWMSTLSAAV